MKLITQKYFKNISSYFEFSFSKKTNNKGIFYHFNKITNLFFYIEE